MTCGECGNVTAPGTGFQNHVYCKRFLLHMEKRKDASKCRDFIPKPTTNADLIRSMTDEELDKFLGEVQWDVANYCGGVTQKQEYPVPEQRGAWLDWLRQEANDVS